MQPRHTAFDREKRLLSALPPPTRIFAFVLLLIGVALAAPGAWLLWLGGSPYYVAAGVACGVAAVLLWRGRGAGVVVYAAVLAGTVAWALWESGLNGWALLPRTLGPILVGLWLAAPSTRRGLSGVGARSAWYPVLALLIAVGLPVALAVQPGPARLAGPAPLPPAGPVQEADKDWTEYGRDKAGTRFSPLAQITPANVGQLQRVWIYHTGIPTNMLVSLEVTPLKIRDRVVLCTGANDVIALDAETGRQIWRYEAHDDAAGIYAGTCRGVAYFQSATADGVCPERVITATVDRRLIALDLRDGRPCEDFGAHGITHLDEGMGVIEPGYSYVTSAPQIVRGKIVFGGWVTDGQKVGEPSGVIRAYDAVTGKFAWAWDMGRPGQHGLPPPGQSFTRTTPNSWAPISADEALGLVYLPLGSAAPGYVGGYRSPADDQYSSSVVALDAETGEPRWYFQTTHHDLWDYDVSSQPTLVDLPGGVKALLQADKRGNVFLLDRRTGAPLASVAERAVPQGGAPGERIAPTQPFSTGMPNFAGPLPSEARMWGVSPFDQLWCRIKFRQARFDGTMTPLSTGWPTVTWPGYLGGMDWGSVAVDPEREVMLVNSNRVGNYNRLLTRAEADRRGLAPISLSHEGSIGGAVAQAGTPYGADISPFLSPLVVPCTQPPFGMIAAVDLRTRRLLWSEPLGTAEESGPLGIHSHLPLTMGVPNIGGAVVTRGGVAFIGAAQDDYLRAYETATGREIWKAKLPAGGNATPMTYWSDASGREFVVIAAGGHGGLLTTPGDDIVAYALPTHE
jgi:quinoprotein glucose dehydrogenase